MPRETLPRLPRRDPAAHKGDAGRLLAVGGSRGMMGAAVLVSLGAYRAGAGLVHLAVPASLVDVASSLQLGAVVRGLPDRDGALGPGAAEAVSALLGSFDVLALGPGLGRAPETAEEVRQIVRTSTRPMVVDADALNAFAEHRDLLARGGAPRILTPHAMELARITGSTPEEIGRDRAGHAAEAARRFGAVVVLKGRGSIVTDGKRSAVNATGNAGLATGGTGDVLTGVIAALLGQGLGPWEAARLGVHLHGLAGDLAAKRKGIRSMTAEDVVEALPDAFRKIPGGRP